MNDTLTLTPALRDEMRDALTEAINDGLHGSHAHYLAVLDATPNGVDLSGHELEDVINYFCIEVEA